MINLGDVYEILMHSSQYIWFGETKLNREMKANGTDDCLSRMFTLPLLSKQTADLYLYITSIVMSRLWAVQG